MSKEKLDAELLERINESVEEQSTVRAIETPNKITQVAHNSRERFLEIELNGAGVIVGLSSYAVLKGQPNYIGDFKKIFPPLEALSGTFNSSDKKIFAVSGSSTPPLPQYKKGMSAVCFTKTALNALNTAEKFNELANPDLVETIPITGISGRNITLEREPLDSTFKEIIILENDGFIPLAQMSNYDANESQDEINVDTQTSGGYKAVIGGLKSASIDAITGVYDPAIPSVAILSSAYNTESTVRVRHGAMKRRYAPYTVGIYKVTEFSTPGETSGNGKVEYKAALKLQSGQIEKKTFI
ncbi:hypothetical protein HS141_14320 [Cetobacterium somerae]|uniref:phage tail protein n=1 Tax=Cetobacterium somerae TaxID=188913 RepID=UPI00211DFEC9|nr:phage tail protein [Cetobacterium somerae]MCQ9628092.1 hypothetical protein [Cetobacterium somerae]